MEREFVKSSMVESMGFDSSTCTLEIEFKNGHQVWQYFDIPESVYLELKTSESLGKYFYANIRGHYREARVG